MELHSQLRFSIVKWGLESSWNYHWSPDDWNQFPWRKLVFWRVDTMVLYPIKIPPFSKPQLSQTPPSQSPGISQLEGKSSAPFFIHHSLDPFPVWKLSSKTKTPRPHLSLWHQDLWIGPWPNLIIRLNWHNPTYHHINDSVTYIFYLKVHWFSGAVVKATIILWKSMVSFKVT